MMLMPPASRVHTQTLPSACTFRLSAIERSRSFACSAPAYEVLGPSVPEALMS